MCAFGGNDGQSGNSSSSNVSKMTKKVDYYVLEFYTQKKNKILVNLKVFLRPISSNILHPNLTVLIYLTNLNHIINLDDSSLVHKTKPISSKIITERITTQYSSQIPLHIPDPT